MNWLENGVYRQELEELCKKNIPYELLREKNILITGATGLIGSYLTDALLVINGTRNLGMRIAVLARNKERAQKRFAAWQTSDSFRILVGDVCAYDFAAGNVEPFDYIIHGAGNAHPRAFAEQPAETMRANLLGTMNLLEYMRGRTESGAGASRMRGRTEGVEGASHMHGGETGESDGGKAAEKGSAGKLVLLSTGEVYGSAPMPDENGWTELCAGTVDSMQTRACYPESKRAAETLCRAYAQEYEIPAVVARLGYIFGVQIHEDNSRADAQFLRRAAAGEDIVMKSAGLQERSYCYLADAAQAILLIMLKGEPSEAYNVAVKGNRITIRGFAEELAKAFGVRIRTELPDEKEQAGYSKMTKEILNPQKLYGLGFAPAYTVADGMRQMRRVLDR